MIVKKLVNGYTNGRFQLDLPGKHCYFLHEETNPAAIHVSG